MRILFMIPNLGQGGAEKVLVNLVNHMDKEKFDITVMTLYDEGVNRQFLSKDITYRSCMKKSIPGISHFLKLFSAEKLYNFFVKDKYDIVISYLEGQTARIISGCKDSNTKKLFWIHCTMNSEKQFSHSFRSLKEAKKCYCQFDGGAFVSQEVKIAFERYCPVKNGVVLYNTNDTDKIINMAKDDVPSEFLEKEDFKIIAVGKIEPVKGFDLLARVHKRLVDDGLYIHTFILGEGSQKEKIEAYVKKENISDSFSFLGYQTNPYKYIAKSDLFVCSSYSEGFSTATTEALVMGIPVVTTEVSGMKEMLGETNEFGIITENTEDALYEGIKKMISNREILNSYKIKAQERGKNFDTSSTVQAVEEFFVRMME